MTSTPLTERYLAETGNRDYALSRIPMGRFGAPEDIVGAAVMLASPAGAFITGQTIYVDGGRSLV
jgi:NAD(P)-dependent dehydrogenase (short-subunit alcohol dehydrogenase family)